MKQLKKRLTAFVMIVYMITSVCQVPVYAASKTPAPKVTSVVSSAYNKVTTKWKKVRGASKYAIYYKNGSKAWKRIAIVKSSASSYTHKSSSKYPITVGKTYKYAVKAYKKKKWSKYSNSKSVKTIPNTITLKSINYNKSKQTVKLTWNKAYGCNKYQIYRKAYGQKSYKKIATVAKKYTSYTDKSPVIGKKNTYFVKGYYSKTKTAGKYKNIKSIVATKPHTHTCEWITMKEATCAETGSREYQCTACGNVSETETIPATGNHQYDAGKVTKEATSVADGEKTYTCTGCGHTKTERIPAIGNSNTSNTSTKDSDYKSWRKNLENQLWTSSMTDKQKLDAVESYIVNNFKYDVQTTYAVEAYKTSKSNCFGAAEMMGDFAKDLGLTVMYQDRDSGNTYTSMNEAIENFNGHIYTLVKINETWYRYDATPEYGDGSNGGTKVTL